METDGRKRRRGKKDARKITEQGREESISFVGTVDDESRTIPYRHGRSEDILISNKPRQLVFGTHKSHSIARPWPSCMGAKKAGRRSIESRSLFHHVSNWVTEADDLSSPVARCNVARPRLSASVRNGSLWRVTWNAHPPRALHSLQAQYLFLTGRADRSHIT